MRIGDLDLTAAQMMDRVRAGRLLPSQMVAAALSRIEDCNPAVNAVCTVAAESAMAAAFRADALLQHDGAIPPLLGLPVGIKDVTPTAGLRTTYGSPLCREHVPAVDAEIVRRFRAAGAIIVGKTNTPEFAAGANTVNPLFGATRNPWQLDRSAGGSTGGGAAALASGMIALAQGTDLGGSLRVPAAFCGVVGLRPSPGLIPSWPAPAPWDTLQVDGPMAATAEDVWLALKALAGPSALAPVSTPPRAAAPDGELDWEVPRRITYVEDVAGYGIDADIAECCRETVDALNDRGWTAQARELDLSDGRDVFLTLRGQVLVAQLWPFLERMHALGENLRGNLAYGLGLSTRAVAEAQHRRQLLRERVLDLLGGYELIVTPCTPVPPFPVSRNYPETINGRAMQSYIDWVAPTFLLSLLGMPVVSVPVGVTRKGLPVGMQILGAPWSERGVLAAAAAIQRCRPLPRLAAGNVALATETA